MVSYLIENMIDYLIGNSVEAKILRENFIFFIVPMLNIDGVVNGNYRCNLAGFDLISIGFCLMWRLVFIYYDFSWI